MQGLLSDIPRKSAEPIAEFRGQPRRAMEHFVGAGPWEDGPLLDLLVEIKEFMPNCLSLKLCELEILKYGFLSILRVPNKIGVHINIFIIRSLD